MGFLNDIYFNIIDIMVISIILISCIVAAFRGFVKEAFSIVSWLFSLIAAFQLYEALKLQLLEYIKQEIIVDIIAFGFPFLISLFITNLISSWLAPKFSIPGLLIIDKLLGLIFGILRGVLFVTLLFLGFSYLLGTEKNLPNIIPEAYTFKYIKSSSDLLVNFFNDDVVSTKMQMNNKNQDLLKDR